MSGFSIVFMNGFCSYTIGAKWTWTPSADDSAPPAENHYKENKLSDPEIQEKEEHLFAI